MTPPCTEDDVETALWHACSPEGGWPRMPISRRHSPVAWEAYRHLEGHGMVVPTGNVRGDRTEFRATGKGRALLAVRRAIRGKPHIKIRAQVRTEA